ncbi:MAG TPA: CHASE domain-containing protein, partial [Burkholderiaceae bacterium]
MLTTASWLVRDLGRNAGLAAVYALVAWASLLLAIPPSAASPLFPAAGLALAAVLTWGPRCLYGVFAGAFVANAFNLSEWPTTLAMPDHRELLISLGIATGNSLQAWIGAALIRRALRARVVLQDLNALARFYGLGMLSCVISASIGTATLVTGGVFAPSLAIDHWALWWVGDSFGVLIAAPATLCLIGRPSSAWRERRLSVGLPMLVTTLLLALGIRAMLERDEFRTASTFERDATQALNALDGALREPLLALDGTHSLFVVAPRLTRSDFEQGTQSRLGPDSPLQAMGWIRRVPRSALADFNQGGRAEGFADFHAYDRNRPGDQTPPAGEDMLAIRLIEPLASNAAALGVNVLSIPAPRATVLKAIASGQAQATPGFQLTQFKNKQTGVVIYQPVYARAPLDASERAELLYGIAFATLRPDAIVTAAAARAPHYLSLCLIDTDATGAQRHLAGSEGCEGIEPDKLVSKHDFMFAGRAWQALVSAPKGLAELGQSSSWPFALVGLGSAVLLGMLLLVVTGRSRLVEQLVRQRTAALNSEIQQRELASAALLQSEKRFRKIFDNVPVGLLFTSIEGVPQEANSHYCRLIGYSIDELLRMRVHDFTHPDDRAEDLRLLKLVHEGKISHYRRTKRYIHKDGHIVHVRVTASALPDEQGKVQRLVSSIEDISDELRMSELERARDTAEGANRAKNDFLSRMSHELRTPLNAVLGFTQLLELDADQRLSPRQKGWAAQAQHAGWHLLNMIDDTLDFSRIESGSLRLDIGPQALRPLIDDACMMIEADAANRRVAIHCRVDADASEALGDSTRIKQVLTNLLSNAVKYNVGGGRVDIDVRRQRPGGESPVEVRISDTGIGLSQEQLSKLFQPFNRLGRERSSVGGTGIGLVISKRLAEMMGGTLTASSTQGVGSTFVFSLPPASGAQSHAAARARPSAGPSYG